MNDDALIRLVNLKALGLSAKQLSDRCGNRVSYWSDLLRGKKSFGEKTARNIEEKLGLPRGAMDAAEEDGAPPSLPEAPALAPVEVAAADDLARALAVVATAIAEADKMTRASVGPLFSLLADEPNLSGTIAQRVHKLLTDNVSEVLQEDNAASGRRRVFHADKPGGAVLGQHDKRDSVQTKEAGGKR